MKTSRRAFATTPASSPAVTALRRSRRAIGKVDGELDGILDWLHDPRGKLDARIPERLAAGVKEADQALGSVGGLYASTLYVLY